MLRPKKPMFGGYESYPDEEYQEEESEKEEEVVNQFDIQHLLSNIPKPVRQKPKIEEIVSEKKGKKNKGLPEEEKKGSLIVTMEKAQPKKWDAILSREEERGKFFKG